MTAPNYSTVTLQPKRLGKVVWSMLVALLLCSLLSLNSTDWMTTRILLGTCGLLVIALWLIRQDRTRQAGNLVLATLTLSMSFVIYESQGIRDPAVLAFRGIMVFASMFATRRIFISIVGIFLSC